MDCKTPEACARTTQRATDGSAITTAARIALFVLAAGGMVSSGSVSAANRATADVEEQIAAAITTDSTCSSAGRREMIDGRSQCACLPEYSGETCELCAAGFQRDGAGRCVLGSIARKNICFDKGTPYLNQFGEIACRCDAGFSGPDCGGPKIVVDGANVSVRAGGQLTLRAKGGSGSYLWVLPTGRGALAGAGGSTTVYIAPTDVQQVEIVPIQIRDVEGHGVRDINVTVTPGDSIHIMGVPVPELASFDQAMLNYMKGRGIRAGVLAVAKDGHLVLSRGYGYMDKGADADPFVHDEGGVGLVGASTPFRIASITKPITAAAVREALEDEQLSTDEFALDWINASLGDAQNNLAELWFPYTSDGHPYYVEQDVNNAYQNCLEWQQGTMPDSRWQSITIQHLLAHKGGFDRDLVPSPRWSNFPPPPALSDTSYIAGSGDPNFKPVLMIHDLEAATGVDFAGPLNPKQLVQYMAGLCLAFQPGTGDGKYSNFGYTLLGRVLEGLHGQQWAPGNGVNRRHGWGPYIDIIDSFLASHGIEGIRAGGTGSYSSENPDTISVKEPYYRHLKDDGTETAYLNVGDDFGIAPNGDMYFGPPGAVPAPYGGFSMQTMESHGGLVATAPGLIQFMRHFRLAPKSDYGEIGTIRTGTDIGDASHSGLLAGTYGLAWQMPSGNKTFTVPALVGMWDQKSALDILVTSQTNCSIPTGVDVVALFNQSTDPKDGDASEYGKISQFLGRATCQVATWPIPLPTGVVAK
jgi:CubicO group peptidase (beta-lactamase class C family)